MLVAVATGAVIRHGRGRDTSSRGAMIWCFGDLQGESELGTRSDQLRDKDACNEDVKLR